jgi:hypothetical protein
MSRWLDIVLPENYKNFNYTELLLIHILPIIGKYEGSNINCAYESYTDIEVKFKSEAIAKKTAKELNILFKKIEKEHPDMLSDNKIKGFKLKASATVMPKDYEKTGGRNIVRPDYSFDKNAIKTFKKCKLPSMKKTKKNNKPI